MPCLKMRDVRKRVSTERTDKGDIDATKEQRVISSQEYFH